MSESPPPDLPAPQGSPADGPAFAVRGLGKRFGDLVAVRGIDLDVPRGSFFGLVGPNGAGKTTTLSMVTGLLRPDAGRAFVLGHDVWADPTAAKRLLGVLPDGLRTFDRLTGLQLITYAGLLRGMPRELAAERAAELVAALGLTGAQGTLVVDYSAGMTKKVTLAAALVHAPRVLVLDEPFEAVDPLSAATIRRILADYVDAGGTVVLSSHVMDLVERICSHVAVIAEGAVLTAGELDAVRDGRSLEERFVDLVGGTTEVVGLSWLRTSSD
ncbi:ABC transporter ATP-binding protein [Intrasporangium flavum]|uniref:ABC transporter ATP-binding protein n=1 Tax=Intrasporangium flavum TaxID=1428657 RepID=UPI00096C2BFD|nr:ABC transporter ATP-binding protein [Intrasporangium flavum]